MPSGFLLANFISVLYNNDMKKLFRLLLPVAALALFAVGCGSEGNEVYEFYTNIPDGQFTLLSKNYEAGEKILGFTAGNESDGEFTPPEGFTSKSQYYFQMSADAQLIVSLDFSAEGALEKYASFTQEVGTTLRTINKAISATEPNSDIYNFNSYDAGVKFEISKITYEVLTLALDIYNLTDGYYNPALYYNIEAYGFGNSHDLPENSADLPDDETIERYTDLAAHFGDIVLSEDNGKYYVKKPSYTVEVGGKSLSMKLDLGGIGKGYAVDCIDELFDKYGYNFGYFNFGSSSMLLKSNVLEGNYTVELINPRSKKRDGYIRVLARNEKLSTSGDNEQYYTIGGVRYCHIIDPTTGKPVQNGIMSATIIGGGAAEDDALTTAIMCMGKDKAIKFIQEKLTDRRVIFTVE